MPTNIPFKEHCLTFFTTHSQKEVKLGKDKPLACCLPSHILTYVCSTYNSKPKVQTEGLNGLNPGKQIISLVMYFSPFLIKREPQKTWHNSKCSENFPSLTNARKPNRCNGGGREKAKMLLPLQWSCSAVALGENKLLHSQGFWLGTFHWYLKGTAKGHKDGRDFHLNCYV